MQDETTSGSVTERLKQNDVLNLTIGLVSILVIAVLVWLLFSNFAAFLLGLNGTIAAAIVASAMGLISVIYNSWNARVVSVREAHREKKSQVYSVFFDMITDVHKLSNENLQRPQTLEEYLSSEEFMNAVFELKKGIIFFGSPAVVVAAINWFKAAGAPTEGFTQMKLIGELLLAMREDIGLSNRGLTYKSMIQINVTDDLDSIKELK